MRRFHRILMVAAALAAATVMLSARQKPANTAQWLASRRQDQNQDITASIENASGSLQRQATVWQMNHSDLKATHTFGDDSKVRPTTSTTTLAGEKGVLRYTFPAHSLTILTVAL